MSDDLKRIEGFTAAFEKSAVTIGFLLLLLSIWVRAPHFQMNPAAGAGFSGILGFNVGHAIVFGPVIVFLALGMYVGILGRREMLLRSFYADLSAGAYGDSKLSGGAELVLKKFQRPEAGWTVADVADRTTRALWFFVLPIAAALVFIRRYLDFIAPEDVVPFAESKAWSLATRINMHLLSGRLWEVQAVLPDRYLDKNSDVSAQMPYIYSPLQGWCYLAVLLISLAVAFKAWRLYFHADPVPPLPPVTSEPVEAQMPDNS